MTVKESFNVAGLPTTWGYVQHKDFKAAEDALPVTRVKNAGGVILAKTNVPVSLADWQSYNDIYGVTNNPYDLGRTPGGSSGGSSAALAAGYGALSLGSDIGGSLRVPAFHCGVYAHKPTYDLCALRGHVAPPNPPLPFTRDLSVIGPMARSAADLGVLLDVMAGPDPIDAGVGYRLSLPASRHPEFKGFRVLVLDSHPLLPTGASIKDAIGRLASNLESRGVSVARETPLLPDLAATSRLYMRLLMSFLAGSFPPDVYAGAQAAAAQLAPTDMSLAAERLRGVTLSHRDWVMADGGRTRLRAQWRDLFRKFDAVICPIMPTPAFPHDHLPDQEQRRIIIDGKPHNYVDQLVWPGIATLPGLPATAIPARPRQGQPAARRADRRTMAGGSHADPPRLADRARIRRLHAAADVQRLKRFRRRSKIARRLVAGRMFDDLAFGAHRLRSWHGGRPRVSAASAAPTARPRRGRSCRRRS